MPTPSEDARILYDRQRLQIIWRTVLSDAARDAWRGRWQTRPPFDICARSYVTTTPAAMSDILVEEPTAYAWSQIYGTLRFGRAHVLSPSDPTPVLLDLTDVVVSSASFFLRVETDADPQSGLMMLFWASAVLSTGIRNPVYEVRPIGFYSPLNTPAELDVMTSYLLRFPAPTPGRVCMRAGLVNENNELSGLSNIVTVDVS